MSAPVAIDIDGTVVLSARGAGAHGPDLVVVDRAGEIAISLAPQDAIGALRAAVEAGGELIPVTARSPGQLDRMTLFVQPPTTAITAGGAVVMRNGTRDAAWDAELARRAPDGAPTAVVVDALAGLGSAEAEARIREARFVVVTYPTPGDAADGEDAVSGVATEHGWRAERDGRRTYLSAPGVSKHAALAHLLGARADAPWFAAGDALLDLGMLRAARNGIVPRDSVLARDPALPTSVQVTRASGAAAVTEICFWVRARASTIPMEGEAV